MPRGEVGELWCKSAANCRLYWNRPDATAETFRNGWVVTGDLARIDEEGFLFLVDRAKDMLIRGGGTSTVSRWRARSMTTRL